MPTKIHKNSFHGGMNKDVDPNQIKPNQFLDGYNISLSRENNDGLGSTFSGTDPIQTLIPSGNVAANGDAHLMGLYEAIATVDGVDTNIALAFVYNSGTTQFDVFLIRKDNSTIYTIYTSPAAETNTEADMFVDCVIYKESGTTYAYFTDYEHSIKKLPLVWNSGDSKYDREEIDLLRRGFRGSITDIAVDDISNGDLACGSYQFAYRLYSSDRDKYTRWSLLTNPVIVGMGYVESTNPAVAEQSYGGVGYVSNYSVDLTLTNVVNYALANAHDNKPLYSHYQLAVIENLNSSADSNLTAKVLQPELIGDFTVNASVWDTTYTYDTNKQAKELISIDELTIDDAPIKAVKTLSIKNNRLIPGNVKYHPLDYDNGDPSVANTTGSVLTTITAGGSATGYRDYTAATNNVGYFRDELYRFGVVYEDEFGNFSKPKIIDFSSVTNNAATAGKDFGFEGRNHEDKGALMDAAGDINVLALQINSLVGHPSWASKVHIVRVPRKKKIQFQTPVVPSILVQPAKAIGAYPGKPLDEKDEEGADLVLNVEAANPDGTYIPKNFFHSVPKSMLRFGDFYGTTPVGGGMYGTHDINSGSYQYTPAAIIESVTGIDGHTIYAGETEAGAYFRSTDVFTDVTVKMRNGGGYDDIVVGDAIILRVKRTTGLALDGFSVTDLTVNTYASASGTQPGNLDFAQYNYLIELSKA